MAIISLLMPTRHRVNRAGLFLQSVVDTADNLLDIEVVLAIDDDDKDSQEICSPHVDLKIVKVIAPRASMGELNTRCLNNSTGQIVMLVNDDIIIRTKSWDRCFIEISKNFEDEIYLIHTKDGFSDEKFPIFPILSRKFCFLISDPFPKLYLRDGIDTHIYDIFMRLNDLGYDRVVYLPNIFFEHLHYLNGKSEMDSVYSDKPSLMTGNRQFYVLWGERELAIRKLFAYLCGEEFSGESESTYGLISHDNNTNIEFSSLLSLFSCFFKSKQSIGYKSRYLSYNLAKEIYYLFRINKLKRLVLRRYI